MCHFRHDRNNSQMCLSLPQNPLPQLETPPSTEYHTGKCYLTTPPPRLSVAQKYSLNYLPVYCFLAEGNYTVGNRDGYICHMPADFLPGVKLGFASSSSKSTHTRTLKQGLAWVGGTTSTVLR